MKYLMLYWMKMKWKKVLQFQLQSVKLKTGQRTGIISSQIQKAIKRSDDLYISFGDGKWRIKKEKAERASFTFKNKKDAIAKAREMAKKNHLNITLFAKNGKIEEKESYV